MFEADYEDVVTVLRPKAGTLAVDGAPAVWEVLLDDQDEPQPVQVEGAFSDRSRRIRDASGDQVDTDGTFNFRGNDPAGLQKGDAIVLEDGRAFEILELEIMPLRGSTGSYGQAKLKRRADLPQNEEEDA